jgi:tetratricopeptide (TPR) repeat protein
MKAGFVITSLAIAALCICTSAQENTAEGWFKKGADLFKNQSYEEAIMAMDKVIESNPKNETAWNVKGSSLVLLASNMYDEALRCFDKAL